MTVSINCIPGSINKESIGNCQISRFIYHFSDSCFDSYCLIRIYDFQTKAIVITSHIKGITSGNNYLILNIIKDFNLDSKNLFWINHTGLFSDYKPDIEEFSLTMFRYEPETLFSKSSFDVEEERNIDREAVESLIETSLDPVIWWLGLDSVAKRDYHQKQEKPTLLLLHYYLEDNFADLFNLEEIVSILSSSSLGAIVVYPNRENKVEFMAYSEIEKDVNFNQKIQPYFVNSFLSNEIVVCVCIDDYEPIFTILKRESFLYPNQINFQTIDKLLECSNNSLDTIDLDIRKFPEELKNKENRFESLLNIYLKPKLSYLISIIDEVNLTVKPESKPLRGALIYYPDQNAGIFFLVENIPLFQASKYALSAVNNYDLDSEVVICLGNFGSENVCGIFPR